MGGGKLNKNFNLQIGDFILERGTYTCKREREGGGLLEHL